MAHLVQHWLEDQQHRELEGQLDVEAANGYLIGELLLRLGVMDDLSKLSRADDEHAAIRNFTIIDAFLQKSGVQYDSKLIARIITQQYGSAACLIDKLRHWYENKRTIGRSGANRKQLHTTTADKRWKRKAVVKTWHAPDFLTKIITQMDNPKALDMAVHLKRFEDRRRDNEAQRDVEEEAEALAKRQGRVTYRATELSKSHGLTMSHEKTDVEQRQHWEQSRCKMREHFKRLLQYEILQVESRKVRENNQRHFETAEEVNGINSFEKNLANLGLSSASEMQETSKSSKTAGSTSGRDFLGCLRAQHSEIVTQGKEETDALVSQLKNKAAARRATIKERECRRRTERHEHRAAKVDTQVVADLKPHSIHEAQGRGSAEHLPRSHKHNPPEVSLEERQQRAQARQQKHEAAIASFLAEHAQLAAQTEAKRQIWMHEYQRILNDRAKMKRKRAQTVAKDAVVNLLDLVACTSHLRSRQPCAEQLILSKKRFRKSFDLPLYVALKPSAWKELKASFVQGELGFKSKERKQGRPDSFSLLTQVEGCLLMEKWCRSEQLGVAGDSRERQDSRQVSKETLDTVRELLADVKPALQLRPIARDRGQWPIRLALVGDDGNGLLEIGTQLAQLNHLLLVTVQLAVDCALSLALSPTEADRRAMAASPSLQALQELGSRYLSITQDPKRPQAPPEWLILDSLFAFIACHENFHAGYLLVNYPSTTLQAKLLENKLTEYSDPEVEQYFKEVSKAKKGGPISAKAGGAAARNNAAQPARKLGGLDAVLYVSAAQLSDTIRAGSDGVRQLAAFWQSFDEAALIGHYLCSLAADQDPLELFHAVIDLLAERRQQQQLQSQTEPLVFSTDIRATEGLSPTIKGTGSPRASANELPNSSEAKPRSIDWKLEAQERRQLFASQYTLAERMWWEHCRYRGRRLDLERLRIEVLEHFGALFASLETQQQNLVVQLVSYLEPLQQFEAQTLHRLNALIEEPISAVASEKCRMVAEGLLKAAPDSWDAFHNDLEVTLGDLAQERYYQCSKQLEAAVEQTAAEVNKLREQVGATMMDIVEVQGRSCEATLAMLRTFDKLCNVHRTAVAMPAISDLPNFAQFREAALQSPAVAPTKSICNLSAILDGIVKSANALSGMTVSPEAVTQVDVALTAHARTLCSALSYHQQLEESTSRFGSSLGSRMRGTLQHHNKLHYIWIAELMAQLTTTHEPSTLRTDSVAILNAVAKTAMPTAGVATVSTVLQTRGLDIPITELSTLIDSLKKRAFGSTCLPTDIFVALINSTAVRYGWKEVWQSKAALSRLASELDPASSGLVCWPRLLHSLICGYLDRLPTPEDLLDLRQACFRQLLSLRKDPRYEASALDNGFQEGRVETWRLPVNAFLDLPCWFRGNAVDRAVLELYALMFSDEHAFVDLGPWLLLLCDVPVGGSATWSQLIYQHAGFIKACLLFENDPSQIPSKAAPATVTRMHPTVGRSALVYILTRSRPSCSEQQAADFLTAAGVKGEDISLIDFLSSSCVAGQLRPGGLLTLCDAYDTVTR